MVISHMLISISLAGQLLSLKERQGVLQSHLCTRGYSQSTFLLESRHEGLMPHGTVWLENTSYSYWHIHSMTSKSLVFLSPPLARCHQWEIACGMRMGSLNVKRTLNTSVGLLYTYSLGKISLILSSDRLLHLWRNVWTIPGYLLFLSTPEIFVDLTASLRALIVFQNWLPLVYTAEQIPTCWVLHGADAIFIHTAQHL